MASSLPGVTPSPIQVSSVKPPTLDLKLRVKQAFVNVVEGESLRNKWLTASGLENMIKHRYAFRDASNFTLTAMNKVISKLNGTIDTHDVTNVTGQFRLYKTIKLDGKYTKVCFYYITDLGHSFIGEVPPTNDPAGWTAFYERAHVAGEERLTRSRARAKKSRHWDDIDSALLEFNSLTDFDVRLKGEGVAYEVSSFWESKEAKNLFNPKDDETVEDALDRRIELLDKVVNDSNGYKLILVGVVFRFQGGAELDAASWD
jgi:hypothetical protein